MITVLLTSEKEAPAFCRDSSLAGKARVAIAGYKNANWGDVVPTLEPGLFIVAGTAGALDPSLSVGDLIVPTKVGGLSGISLASEAVQRARVKGILGTRGWPCSEGSLFTSPSPVESAEQKQTVADLGYAAVDMESWWLMALLAQKQWPAVALRVISDRADSSAGADYKKNLDRAAGRLSDALLALVAEL